MDSETIFLGPGEFIIIPKISYNPYIVQRVDIPFGWWYSLANANPIRQASYLEIYIMSDYKIYKPLDEYEV